MERKVRGDGSQLCWGSGGLFELELFHFICPVLSVAVTHKGCLLLDVVNRYYLARTVLSWQVGGLRPSDRLQSFTRVAK